MWSIVDFIIIVSNFIIVIDIFNPLGTDKIRIVEVVLILMLWFKNIYYMRLVTEIAPLVESIFVILNDILYFLIIFVIGIFAFSEAFFIIGQNQVMMTEDQVDFNPLETPRPSYSTFKGALIYGYV